MDLIGRVLSFLVVMHAPVHAFAHIHLLAPMARYHDQKNGPCGARNDQRTSMVTVFEPGQTITIRWEETVNHPSHYRVAFDADGTDDLVDPATMMELYSNDAVLMDGIEDGDGGDYSVEITLPDVECEECTLQLVQVMYDKPPYTVGGNDLYYQCADLVLRRQEPLDAGLRDVGRDEGVDPDLGSTPDATEDDDAGSPMDAGVAPDPGTDGATLADTGAGVADSREESAGPIGGGCRTSDPSFSGFWILFVFAWLVQRRPRQA